MRPAYTCLIPVGFVQQGMTPAERRLVYHADVTHVTAKSGFDHLRDLLATETQISFIGRSTSRSSTKRIALMTGARAVGDRRQHAREPRLRRIWSRWSLRLRGRRLRVRQYGRDVN
jgi:hypothetical protein